jgi:hypothetical protein
MFYLVLMYFSFSLLDRHLDPFGVELAEGV